MSFITQYHFDINLAFTIYLNLCYFSFWDKFTKIHVY